MNQQELFDNNKGLVYKCVYALNLPHISYDDAVQEGMIALWLASGGYDISKGYKFSSYAYKYIYNYIKKQMRKNLSIKPNKGFYKLQHDIYMMLELQGMSYEECVDEVFKNKPPFEKAKFLSIQAGVMELKEDRYSQSQDDMIVSGLDFEKALQVLKGEHYKVWYIIHEHYILSRPQYVIAKELNIGRVRFKRLLDSGLEILRKELLCCKK